MDGFDLVKSGFDHPCRFTCSGWEQGRERGEFKASRDTVRLDFMLQGRTVLSAGDKFFIISPQGRSGLYNSPREAIDGEIALTNAIKKEMRD